MKKVNIISKVVGREGTGKPTTGRDSQGAVDLSAYLLKQIWDSAFELKEKDGVQYLFGKIPLALQYGMTSFADEGLVDLPTLFDGIPIDNQTLYWEESTDSEGNIVRLLRAKGGSGEGTIKDISIDGEGNAITNVSLNSEGTGLVFTKEKTFIEKEYLEETYYDKNYIEENLAKETDFQELKKSFEDFLTGSDTDTIINKWKELEAFLSGLAETDNLATILESKADKTYLDENFITKDDAASLFVTIGTAQTITGEKNFTGGLSVNGCELVYNASLGYWKLIGDLVVTGGITSFSDDTAFSPSTIMDGVVTDGVTIKKNSYGQLEVIGGTGGGTADSVSWDNVTGKPTWIGSTKPSYNYSEISNTPNLDDYLTEDDLPTATTSVNGIASFNSTDFTVSGGKVSLNARVKIVSSLPSPRTTNTLYVIV